MEANKSHHQVILFFFASHESQPRLRIPNVLGNESGLRERSFFLRWEQIVIYKRSVSEDE